MQFIFAMFAFLSSFSVLLLTPALASVCSVEDEEYAKSWGNYYDPQEAYSFGQQVQNRVKKRDLAGIFLLVDGELGNGPRKKYVAEKSFEEIFDEVWVNGVISNKPECSPVGWRGFMLGNGRIWYKLTENGQWSISSINGAVQETTKTLSVGWEFNGNLLHPFCFSRPSMRDGNFQEFADLFGIRDFKNFSRAPGKLFGTKITDFEPIKPSWCLDTGKCEKISLINAINQCSPKIFEFENSGEHIRLKVSDEGYDVEHSYVTLREFDAEKCSELAPNIAAKCLESFLVEVGDYSGGSMGWDVSHGIYGLFDLPSIGRSIVPLLFFGNKNYALNYLDQ